MSEPLVPDGFDVPQGLDGPGFRLEPLGPEHNERDHEAWMSSIDHIRTTPGMAGRAWPHSMTLEENLADLETHARQFAERESFAYSILDDDEVIGCVYIYPGRYTDADVRSWVRQTRASTDDVVRESVTRWLMTDWPFASFRYAGQPNE